MAATPSTHFVRSTEPIEEMEVDSISETMSSIVVSSSLMFNGQLDFNLFRVSLTFASKYCPWLMCAFDVRDDKIVIVPRFDSEQPKDVNYGFFECEFDDRTEDSYHESLVEDILPQNVHEKLKRPDLCYVSVQDLPICAMRVTQFASQFTVGYRLNHAFFDQSSIVYFFTFVSDVYRNGGSTASMACPTFQPKIGLIQDRASHGSLDIFNAATPLGLSFEKAKPLTFLPAKEVTFSVSAAAVKELKAKNPALTTNDCINGFLMQILSGYDAATECDEESPRRLLFARNMRKPLHRPSNVVGDYVHLECFTSGPIFVVNATIEQLAGLNRAHLQRDSVQSFLDECAWLRDVKKFHGGLQASDFWSDKHACLVTNWTSFDYDLINFVGNKFVQMLVPTHKYLAQFAMMVYILTQCCEPGETNTIVVINTTHTEVVDCAKRCAHGSAGLFSVLAK
jgi:hypothetical protein